MAWSWFSLATGGRTPLASAVRKTMVLGCAPTGGSLIPGRNDSGYEPREFSVSRASWKSKSPLGYIMAFSTMTPCSR